MVSRILFFALLVLGCRHTDSVHSLVSDADAVGAGLAQGCEFSHERYEKIQGYHNLMYFYYSGNQLDNGYPSIGSFWHNFGTLRDAPIGIPYAVNGSLDQSGDKQAGILIGWNRGGLENYQTITSSAVRHALLDPEGFLASTPGLPIDSEDMTEVLVKVGDTLLQGYVRKVYLQYLLVHAFGFSNMETFLGIPSTSYQRVNGKDGPFSRVQGRRVIDVCGTDLVSLIEGTRIVPPAQSRFVPFGTMTDLFPNHSRSDTGPLSGSCDGSNQSGCPIDYEYEVVPNFAEIDQGVSAYLQEERCFLTSGAACQ